MNNRLKSILIILCFIISPLVICCSRSEPEVERAPASHPSREDTTSDENQTNDSENQTDYDGGNEMDYTGDLRVVGIWQNAAKGVSFEFDVEGNFKARAGRDLGFNVSQISEVTGRYVYDDFKKFLWLSVQGDKEVYILEFKCIVDDNRMTLVTQWDTKVELERTE